jgi:TusA-related sulfurtransferase
MKLQPGDVLLVLLDEQSAARLVRELGLVRQHTRFLTRPAASDRGPAE